MENERVFDYGYTGKEKKEKGVRTPFQVDRDRIIHSSAFRRMRNKTQVFGVFTLDYYRTRLTHSLEVSQIARSIASILNKKYGLNIDTDLIEAISLAHDIGHPPFGHLGEYIINKELKEITGEKHGFEANAQNIRILNFLEKKFYDTASNELYGLNPTLKTIDGILKYKLPYSLSDKTKHFIYDSDEFILARLHGKSFIDFLRKNKEFLNSPENKSAKDGFFEATRCVECQILNAADDIAYATHDIEDGVESKLIDIMGHLKVKKYLKEDGLSAKDLTKIDREIDNFFNNLKSIFKADERIDSRNKKIMYHIKVKADLKEFFSGYISKFILNIGLEERKEVFKSKKNAFIKKIPLNFDEDSYKYSIVWKNGANLEINALKQISYRLVMENREILLNRYKAENILRKLFSVFSDEKNLKLYPDDFQETFDSGFYNGKFGKNGFYVMCADYIGGMTDMYAIKLYSSLFDAEV
ncbi:MAG: deoxyguanosinetriphosphate triphosphohydrolase family protein [bacterium]